MKRKLAVIILIILSGLDIGLLWSGGPKIMGKPTDAPVRTISEIGTLDLSNPAALDNAGNNPLVEIRPPSSIVDALTAAGTIELINKRQVVLQVDGIISNVPVKVGDKVAAGDLLVGLDTTDLERSVNRFQIDLKTAQAELQKLQAGSNPDEIATAEANLKAAQENLAKVQAGATADELAAAQSKLGSAQAKYKELLAPPTNADLDEVKAELEKADIDRQNAQREYDKIKWRNDKGMQPESAALQKATVEYERVLAKFNRINQPTAKSSVEDALSNLQKAQGDLEALKQKPTPSDLADAQAKVTDAEQRLNKLNAGATAAELQAAEAKVQKGQLDLEDAQIKLQNAQVFAPQAGTVLDIAVAVGDRATVGKTLVTLADTAQLKLTVKVAEVDITKIAVGQQVQIAIDAIRGHQFNGIIDSIAPINQSDKDVVNYPVTIRLTDATLDGVRPGMNAVATLVDSGPATSSWLVPSSALRSQGDGRTLVLVQRGEGFAPVPVKPGENQGEWTLVEAPDLHAGDKVQGTVSTYVDQQNQPTVGG